MSNGGVVITGSAGGVGFAYAGEFMDRGYDVVICDVKDCTSAAKALETRHPNGNVFHTKCDVSDAESVEKLAQFAKKSLGTVNVWINNAGVNGGRRDLRDVPISQVELVVKVNLMGTLLCTKAAMDIMGEQVCTVVVGVESPGQESAVHAIVKTMTQRSPFFPLSIQPGWSDWTHFQYGWKRSQRRWHARICMLWSHQAWITTIDREFG